MIFEKNKHYVLRHKTKNQVFFCIFSNFVYDEYYYFYNVDLFDRNNNFLSETDELYLTEEDLKEYDIPNDRK